MKKIFIAMHCIFLLWCNSMFEDISIYSGRETTPNSTVTNNPKLVTDIYILLIDAPPKLYISKDMGTTFTQINFGSSDLEDYAVNNRGELLTVEYDTNTGKQYVRLTKPGMGKINCINGEFASNEFVTAVAASEEGDFYLCAIKQSGNKLCKIPINSTTLYELFDTPPEDIQKLWVITNNNQRYIFISRYFSANYELYLSQNDNNFSFLSSYTWEITDMVSYFNTIYLSFDKIDYPLYLFDGESFNYLNSNNIPPNITALEVDKTRNKLVIVSNYKQIHTFHLYTNEWKVGIELSQYSIKDVGFDHHGLLYILTDTSLMISPDCGEITAYILNSTVGGNKISVVSYYLPY